MDKPLTIWYCDVCGKKIESAENGYVFFKHGSDSFLDFKIVHHNPRDPKCCHIDRKDKTYTKSLDLERFLGFNGINRLLSFLSTGKINPSEIVYKISNLDGFVDFMRRVQMPYYEEARRKFDSTKVKDAYSDATESAPYFEQELKKIIEM